MKKDKTEIAVKMVSYVMLSIVALACLIPFLIIVSASFSSESEIIKSGFGILPKGATLDAYKMMSQNKDTLIKAYGVTIFTTLSGSALSILITSMLAYTISRNDYAWKRKISLYVYFTMLFSGGAIPSYILISQYLHLRNNILVLILPLLLSPWNTFLLRTYFSKVHPSLIEAAKIDGANEFKTFFTIVVPVAKTGIVTVLLLVSLTYWNDWYNCLMYMTNENIISLQYFLYRVMSEIDAMLKNSNMISGLKTDISSLPSETTRMAMCVFAAGPMIFVFMCFNRYFANGISVGSVKG